jgi:hypothetical protein
MRKHTEHILIPDFIRYNKELIPMAMLIYGEIVALSNKEGFCWAGNKYFSDLYDVSIATVSLWINSLIKQEFVKSEMKIVPTGTRRGLIATPPIKKPKLLLREKPKHNSNSLIVTNVTKTISKKSFGYRCVREWNKYVYTTTHKSDTIIRRVDLYLNQLLKGTFFDDKEINSDWAKRNKVSTTNGREYSKEELLRGIHNLSYFFKEGYPNLKTRALDGLIYNRISGVSTFLSVIDRPPKPLSEQFVKDPFPNITQLFMKEGIQEGDRYRIIKGVHSLCEYQGKINCRIPKMKRLFGTPLLLCKTYIEWLNAQDWVDALKTGYVNAEGKMFKKFIVEMEEECFGYALIK